MRGFRVWWVSVWGSTTYIKLVCLLWIDKSRGKIGRGVLLSDNKSTQWSHPFLGQRIVLYVHVCLDPFSYTIRYGWRMGGSDHLYLSVRMRGESGTKPIRGWLFTDGVFEIPIPSVTHHGWVFPGPIRVHHPSTEGPLCKKFCCLLWIEKARAKEKTYKWRSVRWETKS
jgi:hypothetical protein